MVCWRVFGSAKLLAQVVLEPYGSIPRFLGAFWAPCQFKCGSKKLLAQLALDPHGSILAFWVVFDGLAAVHVGICMPGHAKGEPVNPSWVKMC